MCLCHASSGFANLDNLAATPASDAEQVRLTDKVVPSHYELVIKTDLEKLSFSGTAEITIDVLEDVPSLVLNVAEPLIIQHAVLSHTSLKTESTRPASELKLHTKRERIEITFAGGHVAAGQVKLALRWQGELDNSMQGYYRSSYPAPGGKDGDTAFYALTQFEPTQARRAFPCFDEPAFKATYAIKMISRTDSVALSNCEVTDTKHLGSGGAFPRTDLLTDAFFTEAGPAATKTEGKTEGTVAAPASKTVSYGDFKDDWTLTTFAKTPKVSTYLVAFANGPFEYIEASYKSPLSGRTVPMRAYATKDNIHQAGLALETKVRILPIYESMFDIEYPLSKLDTLVASDFDAGAMENWGLITGRTSAYLYDPKKSGIRTKKVVIGVQSHEVAHQWFGNIVTFDWWHGLWLNESFATLIGEVIMIDEIEPSWKIHSSFINEHLSGAFRLDSLRSSHPIEMPCPDEETIQQIFDAISYSKGASVLKMLSNYIGQKTFIHGVSLYLKKFLYGNTITTDLWDGIAKASGKDVAKIMENWTKKVGFPVITVEETSEGLKVTQNRFLSTGDPIPEEDETIWQIPLELLIVKDGKADVNHDLLLIERSTVIPIKDVANVTYKFNSETCGVYRTLYPEDRLAKLGEEAGKENTHFSLSDRMGLVGDAMALATSGYAKTSGALTLFSKLTNEKENLVWQAVGDSLGSISATWWEQPEDVRGAISKLRRTLFGPVADRLGFEYSDDDDVDTIELRTMAISVAAAADDPATLAEYKRRFALFLEKDDESLIPSDLRDSIFAQSVKHGGEAEYEKILSVYNKPETPAHRTSAMKALCATTDQALLDRTFNMLKGDDVRTQGRTSSMTFADFAYFTSSLAANCVAKRQIWQFLQDNYEMITKRFKGNFSIGGVIRSCFSTLTTEEDAAAVEAWSKGIDSSAWNQSLSQGLDRMRSNAKWLDRDAKDVEQWLKENKFFA
ncbi:BZ3500_MvSof-1268-A1-R1_Chr3-1g05810 [Microbotryum saponariae]|uniref:Aminopeptidase n=1 Tax=Microbotryum saponariae TaxID=289078 RepID=A0A2X0L112_9BASI|nr:BZ3500_MvSof-1268-A1-R1_Chr3-1g05810 [Microbotryum saponariae]SDA05000.1 BZ3501_MvSof-1269-A2-R1_Chr3-1g05480 [Microbotryum saponariae]